MARGNYIVATPKSDLDHEYKKKEATSIKDFDGV
jgi:hypothetical protein